MRSEKVEIKYEPSISLKLTKAQVKDIGMGDQVMASVSGKVVGMRECFDDKTMLDVELKPFSVKQASADAEDEDEDDSSDE